MQQSEKYGAEQERAVRALHDRSVEAVRSHDRGAIEEVFHPAFRSAGGDFQFESLDDLAGGLEGGGYRYKRVENRDQTIEFAAPNVAIVTGQRTVEGEVKGEPFASTFHNTAVYVNDGDDWKVLLWAVTC